MARKKSLGEQLSDARRAYGMSQDELGEAVGAAGRTISTWETDVHLPTKRVQSTLEALYGWPVGTIGYTIRTGTVLPAVKQTNSPRLATDEAPASPDELLALIAQSVTDALELLADRVNALEDQVSRLGSRGQRATRAR